MDLIDRQAAIDALCNDFCGGHHDCKHYPDCGNLEAIQALPSVQPQPEIIRCKDCKHYIKNITCVGGHYNGCAAWSDNGNEIAVGPDDYCSYAERRTDE